MPAGPMPRWRQYPVTATSGWTAECGSTGRPPRPPPLWGAVMDGVHDMGGRARFFGPLPPIDPDEPVFHEAWEGKAFALAPLASSAAGGNVHAFRHAVERVPEKDYLSG